MTRERYESPTITNIGTGNDWHDHQVLRIHHALVNLLADAEASGVVVTVELEPLQPLAMRHYRMVGNVRGAR